MNHKDIDTIEFKDFIEKEDYVILDVRTKAEYNAGHLKSASNIDFYGNSFQDDIDELDKRKKYLLYCRSGNRSRQTMFMMRDLGFEEVYNLAGGIISWKEHGFHIEN